IKKSNEMYDELLTEEIIPEMKRESSDELTVEELEEMLKHLDHKVEKYDKAIEASENVSERKELRSARKTPKQDRKSLQDDYMRNGQLKAAYNVQIATEGQYTLAYDVFPNPGDTRTLIPFLNNIHQNFFSLPQYIVADAGYGSEQNYDDILNNRNRIPLIT